MYHLHPQALGNPGTCDMVLVDRASPRHKLDTRLKHETGEEEEAEVGVTRLRVDIGDLDLGRALTTDSDMVSPWEVVGVSKHLFGAATDLTLRCVVGTVPDRPGIQAGTFRHFGLDDQLGHVWLRPRQED